MEIFVYLALGIGFLLFLSLLFSNGAVEAKPFQVIIQPAEPTNQGGSGFLVMLVIILLIVLVFIMLQSP